MEQEITRELILFKRTTKDTLMDIAARLGIEDQIHYKDLKESIRTKVLEAYDAKVAEAEAAVVDDLSEDAPEEPEEAQDEPQEPEGPDEAPTVPEAREEAQDPSPAPSVHPDHRNRIPGRRYMEPKGPVYEYILTTSSWEIRTRRISKIRRSMRRMNLPTRVISELTEVAAEKGVATRRVRGWSINRYRNVDVQVLRIIKETMEV